MRQQLGALLPAVFESKIQVSSDVAQTSWIALLQRKMAEKIEKVAPKIIKQLLSYSQVSIEEKMNR